MSTFARFVQLAARVGEVAATEYARKQALAAAAPGTPKKKRCTSCDLVNETMRRADEAQARTAAYMRPQKTQARPRVRKSTAKASPR